MAEEQTGCFTFATMADLWEKCAELVESEEDNLTLWAQEGRLRSNWWSLAIDYNPDEEPEPLSAVWNLEPLPHNFSVDPVQYLHKKARERWPELPNDRHTRDILWTIIQTAFICGQVDGIRAVWVRCHEKADEERQSVRTAGQRGARPDGWQT